jgi:hypothetical protein
MTGVLEQLRVRCQEIRSEIDAKQRQYDERNSAQGYTECPNILELSYEIDILKRDLATNEAMYSRLLQSALNTTPLIPGTTSLVLDYLK